MRTRSDRNSELELLAATQRLTPEHRLEAFVTHCRLMAELYLAGKRMREAEEKRRR